MTESTIKYLLINTVLLIFWQLIILLFSKNIDINYFNPEKKMYSQKNWEHNGKFYTTILHIKLWKDSLPQYVGKNGFSKKNLNKYTDLSHEYINEFIHETCRAEWYHTFCLSGCIIFLLINKTFVCKLLFSSLSIAINLPFILIQRYNRIRLNRLNTKHYNKFKPHNIS